MSTETQNKKKGNTKKIVLVVVLILSLCCIISFVAVLVMDTNEPDATAEVIEPEPTAEPTSKPPATPTSIPADLEQSINDLLGTQNMTKEIRLLDFSNDAGIITVTWLINDNLTLNLTGVSAEKDAKEILQIIDESGLPYENVFLFGKAHTTDAYGNDDTAIALRANIAKDAIDQINWENILLVNLSEIAVSYQLHPDLQ